VGASRKFVTKKELKEALYGKNDDGGFKTEMLNQLTECFNKKLEETFGMIQNFITISLKDKMDKISSQNISLEKQIYDISRQLNDLSNKITK
jgi:chaperonin cofactor prefoldin